MNSWEKLTPPSCPWQHGEARLPLPVTVCTDTRRIILGLLHKKESRSDMESSATPTWRDQGNALFKQRDFEQAKVAYTKGIEDEPCSISEKATLLCNRAACLLELGEFADAVSDCRQIIESEPCHAKAHFRLAKACLKHGDMRAASIAACSAVALYGQDVLVMKLYEEVSLYSTNFCTFSHANLSNPL
jgi:tetratricopeptide (TPR) repeat protein